MIIYNRDKDGNIDKNSTTYVESQKTVDNTVQEFLEGSELAEDLDAKAKKIQFLENDSTNTQMALVEIYEKLLALDMIKNNK